MVGRGSELRAEVLRKEYPGTLALNDFTHCFEPGLIHALVGRNGSGKSTFTKLAAGAITPTSGALFLDGRRLHLTSPRDAFDLGIVTIHQELSLVPELSVAENLLLGTLPHRAFPFRRFVDWPEALRRASAVLDSIGCELPAEIPVSRLSVGQQQVVEIAKALARNPRVLFLDEPTSALTTPEVEQLFGVLRRLKALGVTMIYITHRLSELAEICDTVTVLRDGALTGSVPIGEAKASLLMDLMFGEDAESVRETAPRHSSEVVLEVDHLRVPPKVEDVSFKLHRGEILGLAGMLGSGRTEILKAIYGAIPRASGRILLEGAEVTGTSPSEMKALGFGFASENRKEDGLVQVLGIRQNLCLAAMNRIARGPFIRVRDERQRAEANVRELKIKLPGLESPVSALSGGNQQKVVLGNWLNTDPKVLLFDEPSRGVDVHAKRQIFEAIWRQSELGRATLLVSTELDELLAVCDRILVLKEGRIVQEFLPGETTIKHLYEACMAAREETA